MELTPKEAAALLRQQEDILILTHCKPDGDTIGGAAGLCAALRQLGKTAYLLRDPDIKEYVRPYAEPYWGPEGFVPKFVVSVDIAARSLFFPEAEKWLDKLDLAIDHHPSFEGFGRDQCVDASCAACCEIVYDICCALGEITQEVALPLYVGLTTDSGCYVYPSTSARTHRTAAALLDTGIDFYSVNKRHFRTKSRQQITLEAAVLSRIEFFHEGRGDFLVLSQSLMKELGINDEDIGGLASLTTIVEGVDCGVYLREDEPGKWHISVRAEAGGRVDANKVCSLLGGGGHAAAAGARLTGTEEEVKAKILAAIDAVKRS